MEENQTTQESPKTEDSKKNNMMWAVGGVIVILIIVALAYFFNQNQSTQEPISDASPSSEEAIEEDGDALEKEDSSVDASDQLAGSSVAIDSATLIAPGYIVIHEEVSGAFGPVIGSSELYEAGTFKDVSVTLDRSSVSGETLYAMLHDDDGNSEYEFPGADAPTTNKTGEVVVLPFEIE